MSKTQIVAYKDGKPVGYVRVVNYKNSAFSLTDNKSLSKVYSTQDEAMHDIDVIAYTGLKTGVSFAMCNYTKTDAYEEKASMFAERYGIIEYKVKGNLMIYNVSYPAYLNNPRYTIQHIVNLDTGKEETKQLQRYDSKGVVNRH